MGLQRGTTGKARNKCGGTETGNRGAPALFCCGPLEVTVSAPCPVLRDKVAEGLSLYNVTWAPPRRSVALDVIEADVRVPLGRGTYLSCARMQVDATDDGLRATSPSGTTCSAATGGDRWTITVPQAIDARVLIDIEDAVGLVLTTSWRWLGWVPLHAGAVVGDGCCALLTAPSGGGKTTLTAALIRRGWRTLGDDKLLLRRSGSGRPEVRALQHHFNLHPHTRRWFPEVGDLERLPTYSTWTEKRKVRIEDIWPGHAGEQGTPTHLVLISRRQDITGLGLTRLGHGDVLSALLHQAVIPNDRAIARQVLSTLAAAAQRLQGVRVEIGPEAYADPNCVAPLEAMLR